jgi:hypothetical protein
MASLSHTYSDIHTDNLLDDIRERFGGSRGRPAASERNELYGKGSRGSHMPLDTSIHWTWSNPLNILPALVLFVTLIAIVGIALG